MLGWLTIGGLVLVMGILADDWLANRYRRPLSHMRPRPQDLRQLGMEETDLKGLQRTLGRLKR